MNMERDRLKREELERALTEREEREMEDWLLKHEARLRGNERTIREAVERRCEEDAAAATRLAEKEAALGSMADVLRSVRVTTDQLIGPWRRRRRRPPRCPPAANAPLCPPPAPRPRLHARCRP